MLIRKRCTHIISTLHTLWLQHHQLHVLACLYSCSAVRHMCSGALQVSAAAAARRKSLSMSPALKPPRYDLDAGTPSMTPCNPHITRLTLQSFSPHSTHPLNEATF